MNLPRVVLVFVGLPLLCVIERYAYYTARSMTALHLSQALSVPPSEIGSIFAVQSVITIVFLLIGGALAVLTGPGALLVAGFALSALGQALMAFSDGSTGIWAAIAIGAVGQGLFRPSLYALAAIELQHPREQLRTSAFVALYAAINAGALVAPSTAGALADASGFRAAFVLAAVLMAVATALALVFALLWWLFRAKKPAEPAPLPPTGRVLAGAAGLLLFALIFNVLLGVSSDLSYARASAAASSSVRLIFSINPIAVLVTAALAFAVSLLFFFLRVRVSALYAVAAGACIAATAALPLLLLPASAATLIVATVITAVAEVAFVPFALSRAAGDVPARFAPLVLGVWFAATFGVSALAGRISSWLPGSEALLTALFAALAFVLGGVLLVAARPLVRLCYEVEAPLPARPSTS